MSWNLPGRLDCEGQDRPSFAGCRIEALFTRILGSDAGEGRPELTHTAPQSVPFRVSAASDAAGAFTLVFPERKEMARDKPIRVAVFSPAGRLVGEKEFLAAKVDGPLVVPVEKFGPTTLDRPGRVPAQEARRIRGRVIERSGQRLPSSVQVLLLARQAGGDDGASPPVPVLAARTDGSGYFSGDVPGTTFESVVAVVSGAEGEVPVRLADGLIPLRLPIVIDMPERARGASSKDCGCRADGVPRTPSQESIAESPGMYSTDLGAGQCVSFTVPNRAIEEYSFHFVVRTTEPDITGLTTGMIHDAPVASASAAAGQPVTGSAGTTTGVSAAALEQALMAAITPIVAVPSLTGAVWQKLEAVVRETVVKEGGTPLPANFFDQFPGWGQGLLFGSSVSLAIVIRKAAEAGAGGTAAVPRAGSVANLGTPVYGAPQTGVATPAGGAVNRPPGRAMLDRNTPVDWDSTPTFYEAATIAHGHLLHFKQVWYADGYSLGDLLYSLPLAPGQKKLISVVDWERREQTRRDEATASQETLQAALSRDRDISEVVSGALTESSRGGSRNTTAGAGIGTGAAGNGSYQQFNFGALMGISGGIGDSTSDAFQQSARRLSGSTLQSLRDRTLQSASAVRNLRSSIVQTARQGEAVRASTEVVANHNHCHALTVQYFEVLRHLKVTQELVDVQECLFVPLPMSEFNRPKVLRWRQTLAAYLQRPELAPALDAARRVETRWSEQYAPAARYADELVTSIAGELTLTILIPLPPFPEKPKPKPGETAEQTAEAVGKALAPTEGFLGTVLAIATGGASLLVGATVDAAADAAKATAQGARAMAESLLEETSAERRYARFQQEVMPAAAAGFVDRLELYALVGANEVRLNGADFTLVSDYRPGAPLLVSVRGRVTTPVTRASISALIVKSSTPLPPGCRAIVNSASLHYQTEHMRHAIVDDSRVNDDIDLPLVAFAGASLAGVLGGGPALPVPLPPGFPSGWIPVPGMTPLRGGSGAILYTPLDEWEQRSPRLEDIRLSAELVEHLNANLEYYHHALWWTMDPNRRYMLLDGYVAPNAGGRSVASVIDNTLVGIVGNSLVLPVARGNRLDPQFKLASGATLLDHYAPQSPTEPSRVSLPTRGVFAEAVMGTCNACEPIDDTRFWRWEESAIDEPPVLDAAATTSRRSEPAYGVPTAFPTPIVSLQSVPQAPDPTGLQPALDALAKQSFADITGLAGTQANAVAAYAKAMDTAMAFGKEASTLAQQAAMTKNIDRTMSAIDRAEDSGKIDTKDAKALRLSALKSLVGDSGSERDNAASEADAEQKKATIETIRKIPGESIESVETKEPSGSSTTIKATPTCTPASAPKADTAVLRTVRFFSNYPKTNVAVFGTYDFGLLSVETGTKDSNNFSLRPGSTVGYIRTRLPAGSWTLEGRVLVDLPAGTWQVPVSSVVPGFDPFDFVVASDVAGTVVPYDLSGSLSVKGGQKVVDVYLEPVIEEASVEREIEISASTTGTGEINAEAKAGVEGEANALIADGKVHGEIVYGGRMSLSGTLGAGQTLKLTITYQRLRGFTMVQK